VPRKIYAKGSYESITSEELSKGEGTDYDIGPLDPVPQSLNGVKLAILMGPCPEEPEIVVPLDYLRSCGAEVDVIAPWWTSDSWLPAARFWAPTLKIPWQKKFPDPKDPNALLGPKATDYRGVILLGGTWNPAVVRTDSQMLAFLSEAAHSGLPIFTICHGAQILISAGLVRGRKVTGSLDIRTDLENAGADVVKDKPVVIDEAFSVLVSSRDPNDLAPFCRAIAERLSLQTR
jgi:deglycase